jgi:hypothetical protein
LFDTKAPGGITQLLHTLRLDELTARKNLLHEETIGWPPVNDGRLEGALTTEASLIGQAKWDKRRASCRKTLD